MDAVTIVLIVIVVILIILVLCVFGPFIWAWSLQYFEQPPGPYFNVNGQLVIPSPKPKKKKKN